MKRQTNEINGKSLFTSVGFHVAVTSTKGKLIVFINSNGNNKEKSWEWVNYQSGKQRKKLLLNGASKKWQPRAEVSPQKMKEVRKCYSNQLILSNDFDVSRSFKRLQKIVQNFFSLWFILQIKQFNIWKKATYKQDSLDD